MSRAQPILGALMLAVVMLVPPAHAAAPTLKVHVPVTVQLPTQNVDGSPLTDLAQIRVFAAINGDWDHATELDLVPELAPKAGSTIAGAFDLDVPAGAVVSLIAKAVDTAGNTSASSNLVKRGPFKATDATVPNPGALTSGDAVIVQCPPGYTCSVSSKPAE